MKFRLGVNYWPVSSAMYWWQRFDRREVERDFTLIRGAALDSVRIFLLWEDFQPEAGAVSESALANLEQVAGLAAESGLSLILTLFTGHMSGVNWIPQWALGADSTSQRFRTVSGGRVVEAVTRNWYTDKQILAAQVRLAGEVASRMRKKPAVWAYDLGNENSNCVVPPSREAATDWLQTVANGIRSADPERAITIGLHMEDLEEDRNLGPAEAATVSDFLCMHGYPLYAAWADSGTDELLLPFLGIITRWLSASRLDILFEEFGAPTAPNRHAESVQGGGLALLDEGEAARFTFRALDALRGAGFLGAMLWCYGDYSPALFSRPPLDEAPHERSFGLWRADHSAKPAVAEIGRFAGADRKTASDDFGWIDITREDFYREPGRNLRRLYLRFRELRKS
ncbi:MAG TPA: cellulase family glycosylhydrolase [Blastocatellia bacterium]|nr:cellulase family glycosylhydrolase [Blastocatellia bacterium]